jgi:site-specific DNA-methyltransferase (adenine-specific)
MLGDNITSLRKLPDNSIDSIVTDPPYGLSFMNKKWDYDVPSVEFWKEVYRVLKPGGHILSFGGTRTYHRMVVNIEDAGFEIRDQIMWLYGSGFPKSHNIGKAVDKIQGNDREVVGERDLLGPAIHEGGTRPEGKSSIELTKGQSPYEGWGTALKPANEPICVARKPLSEKSVAENVLKWGTGGINIDGCRVDLNGDNTSRKITDNKNDINVINSNKVGSFDDKWKEGRFPANIILDEIAGELLDEQSGFSKTNCKAGIVDKSTRTTQGAVFVDKDGKPTSGHKQIINASTINDSGGASRFFYQAKVSKQERNMGLDEFEEKVIEGRDAGQDERAVAFKKRPTPTKNVHPTVKPVALMSYLVRLVTPPNGIVLDPFMGSGSTGIAAQLEGFRFCGMEMDKDYFKIAEARIENYEQYKKFIK